MARSLLQSTFGFVSSLFSFRGSSRQLPGSDSDNGPPTFAARKRKAAEESDEEEDFTPSSKRRRLFKGRPDFIPYSSNAEPSSVFPTASYPRISATAQAKAERDRALMPPPSTPILSSKDKDDNVAPREDDAISFSSTARTTHRAEDMDEEQMEAARRHAAAIKIPDDSGTWSDAERELFFHLAYRGFEALLPRNWMIDFDTLPLSIFAHVDAVDPPLIESLRDNHFRAAHALRRLLEAGHDVRDRTHVSPGVQREKILERSVKRYLHWALTDVGLRPTSSASYLPTHVVVTHKKGRSTLQTLEEVTSKLTVLAERHRRATKVYQTIEPHEFEASESGDVYPIDDENTGPTLIGLVIISSVLAVVTLNTSGVVSTTTVDFHLQSSPLLKSDIASASVGDRDRIRTIIDLDFSQKDQDVWNALAVAIVAMQIRKEALKANAADCVDDAWEGASFVTSRFGDDELDSRMGDSLDPDL